jgi:hypothetical protein
VCGEIIYAGGSICGAGRAPGAPPQGRRYGRELPGPGGTPGRIVYAGWVAPAVYCVAV